jgi:5-methylcytosine-specific restriction endonuclease McrBC regulatory subunit McrC
MNKIKNISSLINILIKSEKNIPNQYDNLLFSFKYKIYFIFDNFSLTGILKTYAPNITTHSSIKNI